MENITVREVSSEETEKIRKLFEDVYSETFSDPVPDFSEATKGERLYAALLENRIVGMASVWEPDRFIHFLFVEACSRNRKVGTALVRELHKLYGLPLTLKCLTENKNAMGFYLRTGWQNIGSGICSEGVYVLLRYSEKP